MQQNKMAVVSLTFKNELCVNCTVDVLQALIIVQLIIFDIYVTTRFLIFLILRTLQLHFGFGACRQVIFYVIFQICLGFVHVFVSSQTVFFKSKQLLFLFRMVYVQARY